MVLTPCDPSLEEEVQAGREFLKEFRDAGGEITESELAAWLRERIDPR